MDGQHRQGVKEEEEGIVNDGPRRLSRFASDRTNNMTATSNSSNDNRETSASTAVNATAMPRGGPDRPLSGLDVEEVKQSTKSLLLGHLSIAQMYIL